MFYNTSIYLDPATQDYANLNGQIENKNQVVTEIYLRLTIPQKKYMYAKDPSIGSLLYRFSNQRGSINKTQLAQVVANSLQPMVEQGTLTIQEIKIPRLVLGNIVIEINCTDKSGEQIHFVLNSVI
jgi:phage gp46-like protein